jgi:hypothetical protein
VRRAGPDGVRGAQGLRGNRARSDGLTDRTANRTNDRLGASPPRRSGQGLGGGRGASSAGRVSRRAARRHGRGTRRRPREPDRRGEGVHQGEVNHRRGGRGTDRKRGLAV